MNEQMRKIPRKTIKLLLGARERTIKFFGDDFTVYLMDDSLSSISKAFASRDGD